MKESPLNHEEAMSVGLFKEANTPKEAAILIAGVMKRFDLKRGDMLLKEGQICNYIYYVSTGAIRQYYFKRDKEITEYFALEKMGFFCVESFIKHVPTYLNITALESAVVIGIPREPLFALRKTNWDVECFYRTCIENSLITSQHRMYSMQFETARERYERMIHDFPTIIQRVPSVYIASYLGVSPETLSRVKGFK
ncbi:MAG: hypothetical protein H6Q13_1268 [Bacteroidetes bacterium]|nr:hypothetical protein [Bacteroidota bacterium]